MHELIEVHGPVVVHSFNVLDATRSRVFRAPSRQSIRKLAPKTPNPVLCIYNGEPILPDDWDWVPSAEDHVRFQVIPKGGGGASQQVLGIVLIVVGYLVPGAQALIYVGAGLLVSGLLPQPSFTPLVDSQTTAPSPTYNIQLGGNSARLGEAIPVPYGRHILVPDFASQSYSEFNEDSEQFYHALFCLGQMRKFTLESIMIDDTELSHFQEVQTQFVGPDFAVPLSLVHPNVVNAPEVASADLNYGEYVGPVAVCGPGLVAMTLSFDIQWPRGLYLANDAGVLLEKTTQWLVEIRRINDKGAAVSDWSAIAIEELTASTNKPIRRSYFYNLDTPGRYEARVSRQDVRDDNVRAGHDMQWMGLRAYLSADAPMQYEPSATFMAVRIRATSQLSGLSQRKFALVVRRWLPTWNPTTGWGPEVETRSIAWALADVLRNEFYGGKVPDSRIDLQTLYELDQEWAARGDYFDGVFDKRGTLWSALTTIARAGRARPIMRGSVYTFVRDSQQELPVALFSMRNIKRGSFSIDFTLTSEDSTDGLELQYFDGTTWAPAFVTVKIEENGTFAVVGPSDDQPVNPARMSIMGISTYEQAEREALHIVADAVYRRSAIAFTTENEGYLPAYGDLIAVSHDIAGWGISGDVVSWDAGLLTMEVSEMLSWTVGDSYAILVGPQGDVFGPYKVAPGADGKQMQFLEDPSPDVDIYTGTERERTRFAMGPANSYSKMCRLVSIDPQQSGEVNIRAVVEDNRVHSADGGGGGGPGPGNRIARYAPDGVPNYNAASDTQQAAYGFFTTEDGTVGTSDDEGYVYAD